jgi:oligoendopeptidase F
VQADRARAAGAPHTYGANAGQPTPMPRSTTGVLQSATGSTAQARQFKHAADAALHEHAVPRAVVENLVATTRAGTAPLQRYTGCARSCSGLSSTTPTTASSAALRSDKTLPLRRRGELVLESVAPLGDDYVERYRRFVAGGRIDVYESDGKRSGAYNAGVYGVGPYLLLNHNDTMDAMFTFAHEAGHAMHTVLSFEHQPFVTSDYTIFVAEVASTTNERFLLEHLLAPDHRPEGALPAAAARGRPDRLATFYTQVMFADFELRAHRLVEQGQPVTAEVLNALYLQLLKDYYGDALTVDDFYKFTWARIGHFFNSPYYVYQYATCFASSAQLFKRMTSGDERRAGRHRALPDAAEERRQRPPDGAAEEGRRRPHAARPPCRPWSTSSTAWSPGWRQRPPGCSESAGARPQASLPTAVAAPGPVMVSWCRRRVRRRCRLWWWAPPASRISGTP